MRSKKRIVLESLIALPLIFTGLAIFGSAIFSMIRYIHWYFILFVIVGVFALYTQLWSRLTDFIFRRE